MFRPSQKLNECLDQDVIDRYELIRAIMGYINADHRFKTNDFDEAIRYVLSTKKISETELYESFDSELTYIEDETQWDDEYFALAIVNLNDNFCPERIEHVKKVSKKVYSLRDANKKKKVSQKGKVVLVGLLFLIVLLIIIWLFKHHN